MIGKAKTLYSDGTSKFGYCYNTFDIRSCSGESFVQVLGEMSAGSSDEQLQALKRVLGDVVALRGVEDGVSSDAVISKIFFSIKNLMSDRCVVQKRFNTILSQYRKEVVPAVINGWDVMTDDEKEKLLKMNDFFLCLASHSRNGRPGRSST